MKKISTLTLILSTGILIVIGVGCKKDNTPQDSYPAIKATFGSRIDPANLANYANQGKPGYILKDNTGGNVITNAKATLGRVLFYDKQLSINNTVACGSCHIQKFAFGDTALVSLGVDNGRTRRHAMRLINARFSNEVKFFWDERAATLEQQTTKPIQDHAEMGFSGQNGRPTLATLLTKLQNIDYYKELFQLVYGNQTVTAARLQECLAQFVRSIQSFDSKYDVGRAQVAQEQQPFPNFTQQENMGKIMFLVPSQFNASGVRTGGGLGCAGCHAAPEFDIDPNTGNNGIIGNLNAPGIDINNTRSPSLRDIVGIDGQPNGPMMHTGGIRTLQGAIGHYGQINLALGNSRLDQRLRPNGFGQNLNLNQQEVDAVIAFLKTLTGSAVYTDQKWANPFQ
ncbi:MAG: cytochrome-c peroxidase [Bacteroidetes bacterium]|nr:cytochrome-c peroxidase [Bacteroidota bacterium]